MINAFLLVIACIPTAILIGIVVAIFLSHIPKKPKAAVVVILKDGLILGFERKNKVGKYGFVGGKLDANEDASQAAKRETLEEAGIAITKLEYLFEEVDMESHHTTCFYAAEWHQETLDVEDASRLEWLTKREMLETKAAYPEFNKKALQILQDKHKEIIIR